MVQLKFIPSIFEGFSRRSLFVKKLLTKNILKIYQFASVLKQII